MRLIDADKFGEDLMKLWDYSCDDGVSAIAVLKQALLALNNAPTVIRCSETSEGYPLMDLRPREEGEWINHRNDNGHNIADCSLCGKTTQWHDEDVEPVKQCKYCKHCGNEDYCSNCHSDHSLFEYEDGIPRYCWYCGADMKGGAE